MSENSRLEKDFGDLIQPYADLAEVRQMENFIQHGHTTTYEHCRNVAMKSLQLCRRWHVSANERELVRAAFLHDFYLYDWHGYDHPRPHGFLHPDIACANAKKYFDISSKEENIIRSHMWPLTLTHLPKSREAFIVCLADKICALSETLKRR